VHNKRRGGVKRKIIHKISKCLIALIDLNLELGIYLEQLEIKIIKEDYE